MDNKNENKKIVLDIPTAKRVEAYAREFVSNLPIFGHFCHPIFAHKSIKKAAEAAVFNI